MENEYREVVDFSGSRIFFCVGQKLSSKTKFNGTHCVGCRVCGPHDCKELSHGAGVLLHSSLLDSIVIERKDACEDLVSEALYNGGWGFRCLGGPLGCAAMRIRRPIVSTLCFP